MVEIQLATLPEVVRVHEQIPEFRQNPPSTIEEFEGEIRGRKSKILLAFDNGEPVGYSIGFDKFEDGSFYVWMAGVIPAHRRKGVFKVLLARHEEIAKDEGYKSIKVKTWNRRREMRMALIKAGYNIIDIEKREDVLDNRLMYEKQLAKDEITEAGDS